MYFEDATKQQLIQIALYEHCENAYKYEAIRELQVRKFTGDMLPDLIRLWGAGNSAFEVSVELGVPESTVRSQLIKYKLWGRRVCGV